MSNDLFQDNLDITREGSPAQPKGRIYSAPERNASRRAFYSAPLGAALLGGVIAPSEEHFLLQPMTGE